MIHNLMDIKIPELNRLKYRSDKDIQVVPKKLAPNSNSPMMVYLQAGDAELGALFLVRCKDGTLFSQIRNFFL